MITWENLAHVLLDHGVGVVIVDGFEVLGFHFKPADVGVLLGPDGHVSHQVFHEDRIVVGTLGDVLFVGALQHGVELTGGAGLYELDEVFHPDGLIKADGEGDEATLIVSASLANGLAAGAKGGHGHFDGGDEVVLPFLPSVDFEDDAVVEEAFGSGDGSRFGAEVGEAEFDVGGVRSEAGEELSGQSSDGFDIDDLTVGVQGLDEAGHVGALVVMGQIDGEGDGRHSVLHLLIPISDLKRVAEVANADPIYRDVAMVTFVLGVFQGHGSERGARCPETKIPTAAR
jgi:hypothetical protein